MGDEAPAVYRVPRRVRRRKRPMNIETTGHKKCADCRYRLPIQCFDIDRKAPDGRQSYCHECKDRWEGTPEGVYSRTIAWLERNEEASAGRWTFDEFMRLWRQGEGKCFHCTAGLREWQRGGHSLDRIDNQEGHHIPENCVLACAPCNWERGSDYWHPWREHIAIIRRQCPDGIVPWGQRNPRWKRTVWRTTKHLALPDVNLRLAL
jgi:hypothetical protein